jgi:hypothetical protein
MRTGFSASLGTKTMHDDQQSFLDTSKRAEGAWTWTNQRRIDWNPTCPFPISRDSEPCLLLFPSRGELFDFLHCWKESRIACLSTLFYSANAPIYQSDQTLTSWLKQPRNQLTSYLDFNIHCLLLDKIGEVQDECLYTRCGVMNIRLYNNDPVFPENWEKESLTLV